MKSLPELAIVIPCKNEEKFIGNLLESLLNQDHPIKKLPIVVADAGSTDGTLAVIKKYKERLNLSIVKGGSPSVGRNNGAKKSKSKYILFLDADIELGDENTLKKSLEFVKKNNLLCATVNIKAKNKKLLPSLFYAGNNIVQYFSKFLNPYASGMFILIEREKFNELNGFNEKVDYAEDYYLTRQIPKKRFSIIPSHLWATDRRFKKIGYLNVLKLHLGALFHLNDEDYFFKDRSDYWEY